MAQNYFFKFGSGQPSVYAGLSPTFIAFIKADGTSLAPPGISQIGTSLGLYTFAYGVTQSISFVIDGATTGLASSDRYVFGAIDPSDRISEFGTSILAFGTTCVALGTTNVALGTSNIALGTTNVALGTTSVALGTTTVALGTTTVSYEVLNLAQGTSILALENTITAQSVSLLAQGSTILGYGVSNLALGTTILGYGISILAGVASLSALGVSLNIVISGIGSTASSFGTDVSDPVDLFGYMKRLQELLEGNQAYTKLSGVWDMYSRGSSQLLREKTLANSVTQVIKT